jgi:hypothetical protein
VNSYYWLALVIPYCFLSLIFRQPGCLGVINLFNAKISYADILPIRATVYILSLVNEQVSKGAIALYLNRRDGVPGWEVGSSMILTIFCEFCSLILWATVGVLLCWNVSHQPSISFLGLPWALHCSSQCATWSLAEESPGESLCATARSSALSGRLKYGTMRWF